MINFYEDVESIRRLLDAEEHGESAARIRDAMRAGATGTECVMGIRHAIREVTTTRDISTEARAKLKALIADATALLR